MKASRPTRYARIGLFLSVAAIPALLVGCSSQSSTPQSSAPSVSNKTSSTKAPSTEQNATSSSTGGQNSTSGNTVGAAGTNQTGSVSIGTGNTSSASSSTGTTQPSTPADVILFNPTVSSLNKVNVSGRVIGADNSQKVTVSIKRTDTGDLVASRQVAVSASGHFSANLPVTATTSPLRLTFEAAYPAAKPAGVKRYVTVIPMSGSVPTVIKNMGQTIAGMGANFPLYLPTWLPQDISATSPSLPSYSPTVAAKSFNYYVQVFQTGKPFSVNSSSINQPHNSLLATLGGTQFSGKKAAQKQLLFHANESLPNAATPSASVHLLGNLDATKYSDRWNSVVWHEGDWLLVVRGPYAKQDVTEAKQVAQTLNQVYLPPTNGVVWIRNSNDGSGPATPNVLVSFVEGRDLYSVSEQGNIYNALVLASSMKPLSQSGT